MKPQRAPTRTLTLGDIVIYQPNPVPANRSWFRYVGKRARVVFEPLAPDDVRGVVFEGEHETKYPLTSNLKKLDVKQKRITQSRGRFKL